MGVNAKIRDCYQRLLAANKEKKVAITPCMRKMIAILEAMIKNNMKWDRVWWHVMGDGKA